MRRCGKQKFTNNAVLHLFTTVGRFHGNYH
jgi:hypothetical protein